MLIKKPADIKSAEITPKELYLNRRQFMTSASAIALSAGVAATGLDWFQLPSDARAAEKLANVKKSSYNTTEKQNSFKDITTYNNFYELGVDKGDPAQNAKYLTTKPWTVSVEGEVKKAKTFDIDEIMKLSPLEERVYRLRCVEAWSMVIPMDRLPAERPDQVSRTHQQRQIHSICHPARSQAHARAAAGIVRQRSRMALRRRAAHGRSDASAHDPWSWVIR